jgi:hypothetical protein
MEKLIINKGYKEFQINDDENAVIRVKTTDFGLIDRLNGIKDRITAALDEMEQLKQSNDFGAMLAALNKADARVKQELDEVFGEEISVKVFGDMNCLSLAGGQPVALNFLEAILPEITKALEAEQGAADKRIAAYIDSVKSFK